jgi:peptidoglycan hydrolase-like protein with peptidoglycan-binding domain
LKKWSLSIAAATGLVALFLQGTALAAAPITLSQGERGADVGLMQRLLTYGGDPVAVTELIGPTTRGLVQDFQQRHGLQADGIVGPMTWHALQPVLRYGNSNAAVKALQIELNAKYETGLPVTGYFGDQTRSAVIDFQQHHGLVADGIVGHATWDALIAHFEEVGASGPGFYRCLDSVGGTWGTSGTVATLELVAGKWQAEGHSARIGVDDISLPHGEPFPPHAGHRIGQDVDIRLMRTDGQELPLDSYQDAAYSRQLTQHLVDLFWSTGEVSYILFNDPNVRGVQPWEGHDNHLHVHFIR